MTKVSAKGSASAKNVSKASVWTVFASARKVYNSQIDKNIEMRSKTLQHCLMTSFGSYNSFDNDFKEVTDTLLDSNRYVKECEELGLNAEYVAQQVVFDGKDIYTSVRDKGVKYSLGKNVLDYNKPLYEN